MSQNINDKVMLQKTADGSFTLYLKELNETYHSTHGAYQESVHVFIQEGLMQVKSEMPAVLEVGFGTGLNAMLTLLTGKKVLYHTIEPFPLRVEVVESLQYERFFGEENKADFLKLHVFSCNELHAIRNMQFKKHDVELLQFREEVLFDVVYFDAFAPSKQPDVWTLENLQLCYDSLKVGGALVTYCANGQFKRDLKAIGFEVQNPPGPKGKREMTRAVRIG